MLCQQCEKIFKAVNTSPPGTSIGVSPELFQYPRMENGWTGSHHIQPGSFRSAEHSGCYVCRSIFRDCNTKTRKLAGVARTFYKIIQTSEKHYALDFTMEILKGSVPGARAQVIGCVGTFPILPRGGMCIGLWTRSEYADTCFADIQVPREPLGLTPNTFSGKCEAQVREWLQECSKEQAHSKCRQDWRTQHDYSFRLLRIDPVDADHLHLEAFHSGDRLPAYVTMSHCWTSRAAMATKLLRTTEASFKDGLPVLTLPKKFQDAVAIARWMQIDYIWIDALCIIQDEDSDDWRIQSSIMGEIYANSYCNIAATSADPEAGCFTTRDISIVEPHPIADPRSTLPDHGHVIGYDDFWCNSLLDTTLHTRAWVLQERLLSPRTIYFGQEQMFWECRCVMACEAYPKGIPQVFRNQRMQSWRLSDQLLDPAYRLSRSTFRWSSLWSWLGLRTSSPSQQPHWAYDTWSRIIERYMECDLTYGHDKLVAISGIAQKVRQTTGERYLAGHWENPLLAQSLLWYVPSRRQANSKSSVRPAAVDSSHYRAPTWSWASVDAQVSWNWPAECRKDVITIVNTTIQADEQHQLGAITGACMKVKGSLLPVELNIVGRNTEGAVVENGRYALGPLTTVSESTATGPRRQSAGPIEVNVYLDEPMLPRTFMHAYLLPVCTDWQGTSDYTIAALAGLLIRKAPTAAAAEGYERIGVFALDSSQAHHLQSGFQKQQILTLV